MTPAGIAIRLCLMWLGLAAAMLAALLPRRLFHLTLLGLEDQAYYFQDAGFVFGLGLVMLIALGGAVAVRLAGRFPEPTPSALPLPRPWRIALALAILSGAIALAGTCLVFAGYPLSGDEFLADFDATIFAHGRLTAPLDPQWRDLAGALQPKFLLPVADKSAWASSYLPVNAALRALFGLVGARSLTSPLLAAVSVIAIFGVGRRMWPQRPELALVAAVLLANSSQFLVTAMTPFAMTAHLAFNLLWLWLFLTGGRWGHAGAITVGFFACGLHQLAFHPLFAAPFVLQLWLERRWRAALLYTLAYGAICLFWIDYWQIVQPLTVGAPAPGAAAQASAAGGAVAGFLGHARALFDASGPPRWSTMAENLIRFLTWQNPLAPALAALGAVGAAWRKGTPRYLLLGLVLTLVMLAALIPSQGYGWGYRYLNGLLGSVCLLAAGQWGRLADRLGEAGARRAGAGFVVVAGLCLLIAFPIRAWQARQAVQPFARAEAAIRRSPSDIVMVDSVGGWFLFDLVRNDPFLANRPRVLLLGRLSAGQLRFLCRRYSVAFFGAREAAAFGLRHWTLAEDTTRRLACRWWRDEARTAPSAP